MPHVRYVEPRWKRSLIMAALREPIPLRGRPSHVAQWAELDYLRRYSADQRSEIRALRVECREFAIDVRAGAERITLAAAAGSRHAVVNEAERLGYLAERHVRQRADRRPEPVA